MIDVVREWVQKAEGDFNTAQRELRARKRPNYDSACFHCQQCTEKYPKGFLVRLGVPFRPIHDLEILLDLIVPVDREFQHLRDSLLLLNDYAVDFRYPGSTATKEKAREAFAAVRSVRSFVRSKLRLT